MDSISPHKCNCGFRKSGLSFIKMKDMEEKKEMVNHPSHYCQGDMECIDGIVGAFGKDEAVVFCKINAFKYLWRLGHKDNEGQEIGKIKWYLDKYIELKTKPLPPIECCDNGDVVMEEQECSCKESPFAVNVKVVRREIETALKKMGLTDRQIKDIFNK